MGKRHKRKGCINNNPPPKVVDGITIRRRMTEDEIKYVRKVQRIEAKHYLKEYQQEEKKRKKAGRKKFFEHFCFFK